MRRVTPAVLILPLLLAGCPGGETTTPPRPTSQPSQPEAPPDGGGGEAVAPTASPAKPAAEPDIMEQLAALGPRMTFDVKPMVKLVQGDVEVVLERLAMLRRNEENLAKEPWDAKSEASEQGHYMALTLSVKVGGQPWSELPPGEQVGCIGPLVLQYDDGEPVLIESTNFEPLEGRPESAYQYRRFVPPEHKEGALVVTVALQLEGKDPISFEFPGIHPMRPGKLLDEPKPADEQKPADDQKPADEQKPETGEEEH